MVDLESLLTLNASGMVGSVLHRRLVERFGNERTALRARIPDLRQVQGIGEVTAGAISKAAQAGAGAREIQLAAAGGFTLVPHGAPDYPASLATIHDPPLVLYVKGDLREADALAVGLVGSRECTPYGERQAERFGNELAGLGVTVISGLARGIDTRAHHGALRSREGRTIAVLGSGLCRVYPPENRRLLDAIAERGAAISEFPLEAGPEPANFPRRNRIIAGMSLALLVVEASEKSGALITADWAMEEGREVFAVPGSIESPLSRGTHLLIKQGAKLVESPTDLLEDLPALAPILKNLPRDEGLSPLERTVLRALDKPKAPESVAAGTKLPECTVDAALRRLGVRGIVVEEEGRFRKA